MASCWSAEFVRVKFGLLGVMDLLDEFHLCHSNGSLLCHLLGLLDLRDELHLCHPSGSLLERCGDLENENEAEECNQLHINTLKFGDAKEV